MWLLCFNTISPVKSIIIFKVNCTTFRLDWAPYFHLWKDYLQDPDTIHHCHHSSWSWTCHCTWWWTRSIYKRNQLPQVLVWFPWRWYYLIVVFKRKMFNTLTKSITSFSSLVQHLANSVNQIFFPYLKDFVDLDYGSTTKVSFRSPSFRPYLYFYLW